MDSAFWTLYYAGGRTVTEPLTNASIRTAPPNAIALMLTDARGMPIPHTHVTLVDGPFHYLPIFYRRRTAVVGGPARLVATVFGRQRENGSKVEVTLWALIGDEVMDCPPPLIDQTAIMHQLTLA